MRTFAISRRLALTLALVYGAGAARADRLDKQLNAEAPKVVEALKAKDVKAVGVLRFRVKDGDRPESFSAGLLPGNLVTRVENALILHAGSDAKEALRVLRDVGAEASRQRVGDWFGDAAERAKLFDGDYPLAWGSQRLKADAFVTGVVTLPKDYKTCTVTLELVRSSGVERLSAFTFESDLPLLRDLGKSLALGGKGGDRSPAALRSRGIEQAKGDKPSDAPQPAKGEPSLKIGGIDFRVLAKDQAVEIKTTGDAEKNHQMESPAKGDAVVFQVTNTSDRRLGVDVHLNGYSLLFEKPDAPEMCRVFVVEPGKTIKLDGFYREGDKEGKLLVVPFKVLVGDEAKERAKQLEDKAGALQVTVFEENRPMGGDADNGGGDKKTDDKKDDDKKTDDKKDDAGAKKDDDPKPRDNGGKKDDEGPPISLRGTKPRDLATARGSLRSLQAALMKSAGLKREVREESVGGRLVKRELLVPDNENTRELVGVKVIDFERHPMAIDAKTIWIVPKP